jgi:hypothetical protein
VSMMSILVRQSGSRNKTHKLYSHTTQREIMLCLETLVISSTLLEVKEPGLAFLRDARAKDGFCWIAVSLNE